MLFNTLKVIHIFSIIAWMAGLLYLPRLFVNHANPEITKEISSALHKKSITYLDATVSGNPKVAKRKELVLMCGGQKTSFNTCLQFFAHSPKNNFIWDLAVADL